MIAAPSSGQGKTTITLGLLRALKRRGVDVNSAKSGPDYIDPGFHRAATGRACVNLDAWAGSLEQVRARLHEQDGSFSVVEAAMGLWDGAAVGDALPAPGSAAVLAKALGTPVVLVVDVARMGHSVAALLHGMVGYDRDVQIAGVILNRVGSARHAGMVRCAAETVCPVLGVVPRSDDLATPARHLGLVQAEERPDLDAFLDRAADAIEAGCDLAQIEASASPLGLGGAPRRVPPLGQSIAAARDDAFGFLYWHLLQDWRAAGAEISFFSPLSDEGPHPSADAVFLPGGYPELHGATLANASNFRAGMTDAAKRGATIYGECGGYMVLGEGLIDKDGARHEMLGLLRLETSIAEPERHLGYRVLTSLGGQWTGGFFGHEFHYARTLRAEGEPLFAATDAAGNSLGEIGLRDGSVQGSFAHLIEVR